MKHIKSQCRLKWPSAVKPCHPFFGLMLRVTAPTVLLSQMPLSTMSVPRHKDTKGCQPQGQGVSQQYKCHTTGN